MVYLDPMVYFLTNGDAEVVRFNTTDPAFAELRYLEQHVVDFCLHSNKTHLCLLKNDGTFGVLESNHSVHMKLEDKVALRPLFSQVTHFTTLTQVDSQFVVTGLDVPNSKNTFVLVDKDLKVVHSIEVPSPESKS